MLKRPRVACGTVAVATILVLFLGIPGSISVAHSQSTQGPAQQPGETPVIPKPEQQQQGPAQQPGEVTLPKKSPTPSPQPTNNPQKVNPSQIYTLSTVTNLVNVNVGVEDSNGDPIPSLQKDNFRVYDDGVQQTITNFGAVQAPMTVCLVLEFSNEWWPLIYRSLSSAYEFLGVMKPSDWVAVIYFDLKPHILTDFTHDRFQVQGALQQLVFPGFSEDCLYDALAFTIDRMKDIEGRKAIIAIASGYDTFSKLTYGDMLKIAKSSSTPIYSICILEWVAVRTGMMGINYVQAENTMRFISQYSGGQAYFPRFDGEMPSIYQQIATQLRSQYSIGFSPTDAEKNGKYHKLRVDLVDAQGNPLRIINQKGKTVKYRLVVRPGYYAPKG